MVDTGKLRETSGKETVFSWGGRQWTLEQALKSANRTTQDVQTCKMLPMFLPGR